MQTNEQTKAGARSILKRGLVALGTPCNNLTQEQLIDEAVKVKGAMFIAIHKALDQAKATQRRSDREALIEQALRAALWVCPAEYEAELFSRHLSLEKE